MSLSDLGVFGLDKRAAAADEASSGNAAADDIVATGWLGKGCGAHSVRTLNQEFTLVYICRIRMRL